MSTGVAGLDAVLGGGLPANRVHLVIGTPGTGKTTLALQFLMDGAARGERVLYVTLSETVDELRHVAGSHGWSLDGVSLHEFVPSEDDLLPDRQYTILHPGELELGETIAGLLGDVEQLEPARVVIDSLSELRLLARDPLRFRQQVLGLKQFFAGRRTTVLLLDNELASDSGLESVAHSVLVLQQLSLEYGPERRRLRIVKLRGSAFRGGYHDLTIETGGLVVYPRLVAAEHRHRGAFEVVSSGLPELDNLLGGGLARGTSALFMGPAGTGKSIVISQYVVAAAERGETAAIYAFDETRETSLRRADGLGLDLRRYVDSGQVILEQIDPAQLSPGAFVTRVRSAVEGHDASVIAIDSLNGYLNAMAEERFVIVQLHELLTYLSHQEVIPLLSVAQHGVVGERMTTPIDASYLADTVILFRYFEAFGELRRAVSVVKKRNGSHEPSIRELLFGPRGIRVGESLRDFAGILGGVPRYVGEERTLLGHDDA